MRREFKSLLSPRLIQFLERKLEAGEISPEECKELIKEMMLREYEREESLKWQNKLKSWLEQTEKAFCDLKKKFLAREPADSTIGLEELTGTVRSRRI